MVAEREDIEELLEKYMNEHKTACLIHDRKAQSITIQKILFYERRLASDYGEE